MGARTTLSACVILRSASVEGGRLAKQRTARVRELVATGRGSRDCACALRSRDGFNHRGIVDPFEALGDRPTLPVLPGARVRRASARDRMAGDIADLHLAAAEPAAGFATFEGGIVAVAGTGSPPVIETFA